MVIINQSSTRGSQLTFNAIFPMQQVKPPNPEGVWLWLMMERNFLVLTPCFLISQPLKPEFTFESKPLQKSRMQSKSPEELPFYSSLKDLGQKALETAKDQIRYPKGKGLQKKASRNRLQYIHDAKMMALRSHQQEKDRRLHKRQQLENHLERYKAEFLFHTFCTKTNSRWSQDLNIK